MGGFYAGRHKEITKLKLRIDNVICYTWLLTKNYIQMNFDSNENYQVTNSILVSFDKESEYSKRTVLMEIYFTILYMLQRTLCTIKTRID